MLDRRVKDALLGDAVLLTCSMSAPDHLGMGPCDTFDKIRTNWKFYGHNNLDFASELSKTSVAKSFACDSIFKRYLVHISLETEGLKQRNNILKTMNAELAENQKMVKHEIQTLFTINQILSNDVHKWEHQYACVAADKERIESYVRKLQETVATCQNLHREAECFASPLSDIIPPVDRTQQSGETGKDVSFEREMGKDVDNNHNVLKVSSHSIIKQEHANLEEAHLSPTPSTVITPPIEDHHGPPLFDNLMAILREGGSPRDLGWSFFEQYSPGLTPIGPSHLQVLTDVTPVAATSVLMKQLTTQDDQASSTSPPSNCHDTSLCAPPDLLSYSATLETGVFNVSNHQLPPSHEVKKALPFSVPAFSSSIAAESMTSSYSPLCSEHLQGESPTQKRLQIDVSPQVSQSSIAIKQATLNPIRSSQSRTLRNIDSNRPTVTRSGGVTSPKPKRSGGKENLDEWRSSLPEGVRKKIASRDFLQVPSSALSAPRRGCMHLSPIRTEKYQGKGQSLSLPSRSRYRDRHSLSDCPSPDHPPTFSPQPSGSVFLRYSLPSQHPKPTAVILHPNVSSPKAALAPHIPVIPMTIQAPTPVFTVSCGRNILDVDFITKNSSLCISALASLEKLSAAYSIASSSSSDLGSLEMADEGNPENTVFETSEKTRQRVEQKMAESDVQQMANHQHHHYSVHGAALVEPCRDLAKTVENYSEDMKKPLCYILDINQREDMRSPQISQTDLDSEHSDTNSTEPLKSSVISCANVSDSKPFPSNNMASSPQTPGVSERGISKNTQKTVAWAAELVTSIGYRDDSEDEDSLPSPAGPVSPAMPTSAAFSDPTATKSNGNDGASMGSTHPKEVSAGIDVSENIAQTGRTRLSGIARKLGRVVNLSAGDKETNGLEVPSKGLISSARSEDSSVSIGTSSKANVFSPVKNGEVDTDRLSRILAGARKEQNRSEIFATRPGSSIVEGRAMQISAYPERSVTVAHEAHIKTGPAGRGFLRRFSNIPGGAGSSRVRSDVLCQSPPKLLDPAGGQTTCPRSTHVTKTLYPEDAFPTLSSVSMTGASASRGKIIAPEKAIAKRWSKAVNGTSFPPVQRSALSQTNVPSLAQVSHGGPGIISGTRSPQTHPQRHIAAHSTTSPPRPWGMSLQSRIPSTPPTPTATYHRRQVSRPTQPLRIVRRNYTTPPAAFIFDGQRLVPNTISSEGLAPNSDTQGRAMSPVDKKKRLTSSVVPLIPNFSTTYGKATEDECRRLGRTTLSMHVR